MGVVFGDKKLFGWKATFMKKMSDNRYLLKLGGIGLLLKKVSLISSINSIS